MTGKDVVRGMLAGARTPAFREISPPGWGGRPIKVSTVPLNRPGQPLDFGMVEKEIVRAILQDRVVDRVPTPRIIQEAEQLRRELEDPRVFWDKVVANSEEKLREAEESRRRGDVPTWAQGTPNLAYGRKR